ncbi:hypothetical protein [Amycolatopsis minnesotensis]|uniref:Uncharacterized protein n=1 Tax=Amycolatopsis minnesotensis TaxID=337894 RepID=A0ABN2SGY9_9PSEU
MSTRIPGLDLADTDLAVCTGLDAPHAFYDVLAEAFYAVGTADPAAALALMRDHAEDHGAPYPTTADMGAFGVRHFAYTHPAAPGDTCVAVVDEHAPGAFPALIWRPHEQPPTGVGRPVADTTGGYR